MWDISDLREIQKSIDKYVVKTSLETYLEVD